MKEKKLGKILSLRIGAGGYDDAQFGVSFGLGGEDWGVGDFWGFWATERSKNAQWTEEDRIKKIGATFWRLNSLLTDAKFRNAVVRSP